MSSLRPTERERDLAAWIDDECPPREQVEQLLVELREDLLRPFEELRRDVEAMRDTKMAKCLEDLLKAARGMA